MIKEFFHILKESSDSFGGQESGEVVILTLRRHIFTLLFPLSLIIILSIFPLVIYVFFNKYMLNDMLDYFIFATSLWCLVLWLSSFYVITMWCLNTVVITDRRVVENEQNGFFNRKVAELHVDRVQDVIIQIKGFIQTLLNFGSITVQTAGSEREFYFANIPDPNSIKNEIMRIVYSKNSPINSNP